MATMQAKKVDDSDDMGDDFAVGSDDEGAGVKIAVPVAQFQSRFVGGDDDQQSQSGKGGPRSDILDLNEDRMRGSLIRIELQEMISDPEKKEELIRKLLDMAPKGKTVRKPVPPKTVPGLMDYEGKDDPENPENEADFKKAYTKVSLPV